MNSSQDRTLKADFIDFITGRVGIYRSFFVYFSLSLVVVVSFLSSFGDLRMIFPVDLWMIIPVGFKSFMVYFIYCCIAILVPGMTTFGTVWSVLRTLLSKEVKLIHKISSGLIAILLAIFWLLYLLLLRYD